jgi:hypothetical protein
VGIGDGRASDLTIYAEDDGSVTVDVGTRFVAVSEDELERILDRLAADGGTLRLLGAPARADDGDEPVRESDPGQGAVSFVLGLAQARGLKVVRSES